MNSIVKSERATQNRVVKLLREQLGYRYIGNLQDEYNSNIRRADLERNLLARGYAAGVVKFYGYAATQKR